MSGSGRWAGVGDGREWEMSGSGSGRWAGVGGEREWEMNGSGLVAQPSIEDNEEC